MCRQFMSVPHCPSVFPFLLGESLSWGTTVHRQHFGAVLGFEFDLGTLAARTRFQRAQGGGGQSPGESCSGHLLLAVHFAAPAANGQDGPRSG